MQTKYIVLVPKSVKYTQLYMKQMQVYCFVALILIIKWSHQELLSIEEEFNETLAIDMDLFLDNAGYPKPGDIPILNRKVFKGQRVSVLEHPYVVSVRRQHAHYLVGALLTKNVVITVAHPIANVPITELGIVFGESYADRGTAMATVLVVVLHHEFDPFTLKADIAMLRFYEDVKYKCNVKPIGLVPISKSLNGSKAFVTGWGRCDSSGAELCLFRSSRYYPEESFDPMLRTVSFIMSTSNFYCQGYKRHDVTLYRGMLCAGPAREDDPVCPCLGVPGAPLVVEARLAGLLSWGFGCGYGHDLPLVYTSTQHFSSWILHNIVIFKKIKKPNLTQLYRATKAYLLAEWLIKTRVVTPSLNIKDDRSMEPLNIDKELIKLVGTAYDVRDFISDGFFHIEKQNMYAALMYSDKKIVNLMMINQKPLIVPLYTFPSNNTYDEDYEVTFIEESTNLHDNETQSAEEDEDFSE